MAAADSFLTAVAPAVLAARDIAMGKFIHRGVVLPNHQVDPAQLFDFLASRGMKITTME